MGESKSDSDDSSSSSNSSDSSIPSEQVRSEDDDNNKARAKSAAEDDDSATSSEEEEEQQQQEQEGYMFNDVLYPSYQQMVAAKQERNRQVLERTTSEISLMLGSEYGSSSKSNSSKKKKLPSKKLNKQSGPPRRNPKRKARSPSSSSISTSSNQEDIPRKRSRSIGSSSRNSINSIGGGVSSSGKVPSDVFMDNESIATQSTMYKNEMVLLQPYNRLVKDICIQTEQILVNGKRIQERERMYQDFKRRNGDRLDRSKTKQAREEEVNDDMSTHEDITSTVDWKLYHSSITASSLAQGNGGNIGKKIKQGGDAAVEIVVPNFSSFMDDEDDIVIPEEYLAETNTQSTQQQIPETLPINNPVKYNNIIQEQNKYYASKGIDRYWDEQYGDGIDPNLFAEKCCKYSCTDNSTADDGLDNNDNTDNITGTQDEDSLNTKRYIDSLLQRCWDRAVHAASSTLTVSLSDKTKSEVEGAVKTEENNTPPPNQKVINSALRQKARDAVDDILDTLLAKDSSLRLMLEDPKLKGRIDWRDVLDCLKAATEKQEKTREEGVLDHSLMKSLSIRLIERYGTTDNG